MVYILRDILTKMWNPDIVANPVLMPNQHQLTIKLIICDTASTLNFLRMHVMWVHSFR